MESFSSRVRDFIVLILCRDSLWRESWEDIFR